VISFVSCPRGGATTARQTHALLTMPIHVTQCGTAVPCSSRNIEFFPILKGRLHVAFVITSDFDLHPDSHVKFSAKGKVPSLTSSDVNKVTGYKAKAETRHSKVKVKALGGKANYGRGLQGQGQK